MLLILVTFLIKFFPLRKENKEREKNLIHVIHVHTHTIPKLCVLFISDIFRTPVSCQIIFILFLLFEMEADHFDKNNSAYCL